MHRTVGSPSVWAIFLCCYLSVACASNPTNSQESGVNHSSVAVAEANAEAKTAYADNASSEQELERSLQEFDEKILRELEETQQQRQENARQKAAMRSNAELEAEGENTGDSDGEGDEQSEQSADGEEAAGSEGGNETASSAGQQDSEAEDEVESAQQSGTSAGATKSAGNAGEEASSTTQTADIPSGDDDDVVARQLREAAEAETDPEVKEKLWEEYRKYKNQQNTVTTPTVP